MLGGIVETSASFEARSAPRSYPTGPEAADQSALMPAKLDHLAPLFGFLGDELTEIGWRARHHWRAQLGKPRLELRVG
jgi:hypothetical protein